MPSSLRARRESPASRPVTTIVAGREASAKRPLLGRLLGLFRSKASGPTFVEPDPNALLSFRSEATIRTEPQPIASATLAIAEVAPKPAPRLSQLLAPRLLRPMLIVVALVAVASLTVLAIRRVALPVFAAARVQVGNLTINTRPITSEVLVDGVARGTTPLTLSLAAGGHMIVVRSGSDERVLPLTIAAGADVTHNFEMKAGEPATQLGRVSVVTDPPGARVAIDGKPSGTSPLTVANLTAAEHKVAVANEAGSAERTVTVTAGGTASVLFSLLRVAGPVGGWLSITAPFEVEVSENDDVIGSGGASRIMLAAGRHSVTLSNGTLGFQEVRRVEVGAGKTSAIRIEAPKASVSVNARPWADVMLDGNSIGQTPIANLPVSIGSHEMVFKHPQFGQRKQTVTVSVKGPNRIAVDLTQ